MTDKASSPVTHRRPIAVGLGAVLLLVAVGGVVLAVAVLAFLSGSPISEEANQCIGGGEGGYGILLVAVATIALLSSGATLVQATQGHKSWPFSVLTLGLLVTLAVLTLSLPDTLELNVGQC
jgi:hypothetical protein